MTFLQPHDRVLLTGDSITDWGRDRSDPTSLGHGYAGIVAALAGARRPDLDLTFLNRGVGGDTSAMLRARWEQDAVALAPTVVSILVGINDTWRRYDSGTPTSTDEYEENLRAVVATVDRLVLVEPFLVPVTRRAARLARGPRPADRGRAPGGRRAARRARARRRARSRPRPSARAPAAWAYDGVHPTPAGHGLLAEAWLARSGSTDRPPGGDALRARQALTLASWPIVSRTRGRRHRPTRSRRTKRCACSLPPPPSSCAPAWRCPVVAVCRALAAPSREDP